MSRTIAESLAEARQEFDHYVANGLARFERTLRDHGATQAEIDAELSFQETEMAAARKTMLADLESWLRREGAALN